MNPPVHVRHDKSHAWQRPEVVFRYSELAALHVFGQPNKLGLLGLRISLEYPVLQSDPVHSW